MTASENTVEERVARIEVSVEHIQSDIGDMKIDLRRLNDKLDALDVRVTAKIDNLDARLTAKIDNLDARLAKKIDDLDGRLSKTIDALDARLSGKIDSLVQVITDLKVGRALDRLWWLLMSAALLGVMARGFKWI